MLNRICHEQQLTESVAFLSAEVASTSLLNHRSKRCRPVDVAELDRLLKVISV